jgi:chromosomal replication initiation ATPase DnaA
MIDYYIEYLKAKREVKYLQNKLEICKRNYEKEIQRLKEMIINPIYKMNKNKELTEILQKVCDASGIMPHDIISKNRKRKIVIVRQLFCYITVKYFNYKLKNVGNFLIRDHSTVIHSVNAYTDYLQMRYKNETAIYEDAKNLLSIGNAKG